MFTDPVVDSRPWTSVEGRVAVPDTDRLLANVDTSVVFPSTYRFPRVLTFSKIDGPTATKVPRVLRDERVVWANAVRFPLNVV
jgi:hypothetical protein